MPKKHASLVKNCKKRKLQFKKCVSNAILLFLIQDQGNMAFIGNFDGISVHTNKLNDIRASAVRIYPANDPSLNEPMPAARVEFDVCKPCHKETPKPTGMDTPTN